MFKYLMKTECGNQYPLSTENAVSKDDEIYYKGGRFVVLVVAHMHGGKTTVFCRKINDA